MLGALFKPSRFLDADLEDWHLETWAWLMRNCGGMDRLTQSRLVGPSRDFFPPSEATGAERGEYVFLCVKVWMGMDDWPCRLEARERPPTAARVGEFWSINSPGAVNGAFQVVDGEAVIAYAVDLVAEPARLVATFAHELCHYLIGGIREPAPGGREAHELTTELAVAYAGLAVFSANTAFSFEQHSGAFSQGWRSRRSGYFSPRSWAFAIAVFLSLSDAPAETGGKWLKPDIAGQVAAARRYLAKRPALLAPLREIR